MIELFVFKLFCLLFLILMDCSSLNFLRSFFLVFFCLSCGVFDLKFFGKFFKYSWGKRGFIVMLKK